MNQGINPDPFKIWETLSAFSEKLGLNNVEQIFYWAAVASVVFVLLFSLLVVRQTSLMTRFLGTSLSPWIKIFAWLYVLYCVAVLLLILGLF